MVVEDLFLTSRGAGRFQWLAGLYASSTSEHSPTNFLATKSFAPKFPVSVYGDDRHDRIDELAAYGEASLEIAPKWMVAVGGRAFTVHTRTKSRVDSERFEPRNLDRGVNFTSFAPKLSVQPELAAGDMLY